MMFDSLLLLLQKTFLIWDIFSLVTPKNNKSKREDRTERAGEDISVQFVRGDLLEVPRTLFVHFGIYLGDGKVAHMIPDILPLFTGDPNRLRSVVSNTRLLVGVVFRTAGVRVDTLEDFVYGAREVIVNGMDDKFGFRPQSNEEVARTAEKLIGAVRYSLLWNNCEHFVTFCRYGTGTSLQTDQFCERLKCVIRDERTVLIPVFLGIFSFLFLGFSVTSTLSLFLLSFIVWMAG